MSEIENLRVPSFCPICAQLMRGKSTGSFYDFGCCVNCKIYFVEGREERWKSGWRPDPVQVARMIGELRGYEQRTCPFPECKQLFEHEH